jgi:pimeloyl-ACP methyl ester carboxylesterase
MKFGRVSGSVVLAASLVVAVGTPAVAGAKHSLPHVTGGHRPGPSILYTKPAHSPLLANRGIWHAKPILVSGTSAYRDGEWLYQDYLFDDHGALGTPDPTTPYSTTDFLFAPVAGTYTYPTSKVYADNAADLVEFRTKPLAHATAFRVTLNSMHKAALVGFTIRLGGGATHRWPFGAGVSSAASRFLTVHGRHGVLTNAATGKAIGPKPTVRVSVRRHQFTVLLPHRAWNPHHRKVPMTIGTGLWNRSANTYLKPAIGPATATRPGGGSATGVALVNVGPRYSELWPKLREPALTIGDAAAGGIVEGSMWREHQQAEKLAQDQIQNFSATVNFRKLARRVTDNARVPTTGAMDRIMVSHFPASQGLDPTQVCSRIAPPTDVGASCVGRMGGRLQPYAIYVPKGRPGKRGYGLTLLLHSLSANYNQFSTSHNQSQLGNRGRGTIVITPSGRGPDGGYAGVPEADTFETWNTVAHLYKLDPRWTSISGYSMGGYGAYRLAERWPDLFARAFSVVGAPSPTSGLPSMRNVPLLAWNATADELVNLDTTLQAIQSLTKDGLRFTEDLFTGADHLTLATDDQYLPGAHFLGTHRVNRNPMHVTFVVDHSQDNRAADVVANHAYWLSGITARHPSTTGTIDVRSLAFGYGDARVQPVRTSAGVLSGGAHVAMPYAQFRQTWHSEVKTKRRNRLVVHATNIRRVVVDPVRAKVDCHATLAVKTDGPVTIQLAGCHRTIHAH